MCLSSGVRARVSEEWLLLTDFFSLLCMSLKILFKDVKNPFYLSGFLGIHVCMYVCMYKDIYMYNYVSPHIFV